MTIDILVPDRDYSLVVPERTTAFAAVREYVTLTDGTNTLTDGTNTLTAFRAVEGNVYVIMVPARDYSLIVPEATDA